MFQDVLNPIDTLSPLFFSDKKIEKSTGRWGGGGRANLFFFGNVPVSMSALAAPPLLTIQ